MIEAIFFDQDNTIVNTKAVSPRAYRQAIDYLAEKMEVKNDFLWRKWRKVVRENRRSLDPKIRSLYYLLFLVCKNKKWVKEAVLGIEKMLKEKPEILRYFILCPKKIKAVEKELVFKTSQDLEKTAEEKTETLIKEASDENKETSVEETPVEEVPAEDKKEKKAELEDIDAKLKEILDEQN